MNIQEIQQSSSIDCACNCSSFNLQPFFHLKSTNASRLRPEKKNLSYIGHGLCFFVEVVAWIPHLSIVLHMLLIFLKASVQATISSPRSSGGCTLSIDLDSCEILSSQCTCSSGLHGELHKQSNCMPHVCAQGIVHAWFSYRKLSWVYSEIVWESNWNGNKH